VRNALIGLVTIVAVSCGGSAPAASTAAATPSGPATVAVATNAKLGQILVDGGGRTLYLFEADTSSSSTCYASCATYWPPLLTNGSPVASSGADAMLLGTAKRTDGSVEVTYNGHPLYYVVTDHNPGDATGQAVNNFGALWYVVGPTGNKISG
jgi:predicted lipoprotein with Yx(FWY)xxD motif